MSVTFTARIEQIKFYNETNGYHIMFFSTDTVLKGTNRIHGKTMGTLVGTCITCDVGNEYIVEAEYMEHPKFGPQYKIISLKYDKPTDFSSLYTFLSTIISESHATVLYNNYPDIIDRVMEDHDFCPVFSKLKGIQFKTWEKIRNKIIENFGYMELINLLSPIGVTLTTIKKIGKGVQDFSLLKKRIIDNPYILCEVQGLGFKKVDGFALKLNPTIEYSDFRAMAAIRYILQDLAENDGHSFIYQEKLRKEFKELVHDSKMMKIMDEVLEKEKEKNNEDLQERPELFVTDELVGLYSYKIIEEFIYNKLKEIQTTDNIWDIDYSVFFKRMEETAEEQGFYLSNEQTEVVRSIAENNITIISGKAGTGKTSVIKAILNVYKDKGIQMCALSAKAAKRMKEVTNFEGASTIHRLFGLMDSSNSYFSETAPLPCDLLILDECSMNNIFIFNSILKSISNKIKIVLAGDFCQLPSIGVGSVFSDLVHNPIYNNHLLSQVYRQSDDSFINVHANVIREGIMPFDVKESINCFGNDTMYVFRNKSETIVSETVQMYLKFLKNINIQDIIVVVPRKDTVYVSCEGINNEILNKLLPDEEKKIEYKNKIFKKGCRVINKKNDYEKGVLNGELGMVTVVDMEKNEIWVQFDEGHMASFSNSDLDNIELGYAISVHSSQGSQYKICIVAMDMSSYILLNSNLIYTAMTRGCEKLLVISQISAFKRAVSNMQEHYRNTFLKQFLKDTDKKDIISMQKEHVKNHYIRRLEDKFIINEQLSSPLMYNSFTSSFDPTYEDLPF